MVENKEPQKWNVGNPNDLRGRNVSTSISRINQDVEKAIGAGADLLAIAGICIAMDILAQQHYLNAVFLQKHPIAEGQDERTWAEEHLFPKWEKFKRHSIKPVYLWALQQWGVSEEYMRNDILDFRHSMIHSFIPYPFSTSPEKSPNGKIINRSGNLKILHLPDFFEFEKRSYSKVTTAPGAKFDILRRIETIATN